VRMQQMITGWADEKKRMVPPGGVESGVPFDWRGRRVIVVGLARSGRAAVELLLSNDARVTVTDSRTAEELGISTEDWVERGVSLALGGHPAGLLHGAEIMVVSPGVPGDTSIVLDAAERGIPVIGELELAYRFSEGTWLAVTGTNGKTTTTALLGALVATTGRPSVVAGNIGIALSAEVADVPEDGYVVAEVSSFQLDTIDTFKPKVAVLLNITEDHLDRYPSFRDYAESKRRVFENQKESDYAVLNVDDQLVGKLAGVLNSTVIPVSVEREVAGGVFVREGTLVSQVGGRERAVIELSRLGLPGPHNLANAAAATAAALAVGVQPEDAAHVLAGFRPLEHRLEPVAEIDGVLYVNDSKATNVESVMCALQSYDRPIVLIAGGRDKDADFDRLAELVGARVKALVLLGEAAPKLNRALGDIVPARRASSLDEAVRVAADSASPGDVILLSPACASFDMFRDFEDRGDRFREAVGVLERERAEEGERGRVGVSGNGEAP